MDFYLNFTNTSLNLSRLSPSYHGYYSQYTLRLAILLGCSTVTLILGLSGAVLVLLAITKHRGNRKLFFYSIITSLVITIVVLKCLHMIFNIPTYALGSRWIYGDTLCKISNFIYHVTSYGISYHVILLMFYVIFCIKHPLVARKMDQNKTTVILIVVFWLVIILINAESLAHHQAYKSRFYDYQYCMIGMRHVVLMLVLFILEYLVPFFLMIGLCIAIGIVARQRRNNRYVDLENDEERHLQEFVKLSIMFAVLHVVFSVCDVVFQMFLIGLFGNISFIMSMLYPAIIPWVLLGCVREFRQSLKNVCSDDNGTVEVTGAMCNAANVEEADVVVGQGQTVDGEYGYNQPDDKTVLSNKDNPNSVLVEEI